ncbi:MAG: thiamine phosphate synthase [Candidatus Cybelea sp.]
MAAHAPGRITRSRRAELLRGIYVIINEEPRALELSNAVLDAGVRLVQYRAKNGILGDRIRSLRTLTRTRNALLLMNDDWRAAVEYDCDGVHLGPGDNGFERVAQVREALEERLIGLSCGTIEEVRAANESGADYLGIGSVFPTSSKSDAGAPIGIEGFRQLARASAVPVAAIGGITASSIPEVRRAGAAMAAVISAIAGAPEPRRATEELVGAWNRSEAP